MPNKTPTKPRMISSLMISRLPELYLKVLRLLSLMLKISSRSTKLNSRDKRKKEMLISRLSNLQQEANSKRSTLMPRQLMTSTSLDQRRHGKPVLLLSRLLMMVLLLILKQRQMPKPLLTSIRVLIRQPWRIN
jgi:hypothetical protein